MTWHEDDAESRRLPQLAEGDRLKDKGIDADQHFTQPPPRYSEATLVKRLEELGIGRPSTYASTMAVLVEREYVKIDKKRLVPEDKGRLVIAFLESFFMKYVEYDFTAGLEEKLDLISNNELKWKDVLRDFWKDFIGAVDEIKDLRVGEVLDALNEMLGPHVFPPKEDGSDPRACPKCGKGKLDRSRFPASSAPSSAAATTRTATSRASSPTPVKRRAVTANSASIPTRGLPMFVKSGRFGTYLQLGDQKDYAEGEKPKRSSIPKGIDAATIDLEKAMQLLSLPREVGIHPETATPITAGLGRYGPFILHDGTYANVETIEDVFTIGVNRAVTLLADKRAGKGGGRFGRAAQKTVLKDLGEHPERRRQDRSARRQVRRLRQPQQGQRHRAQGQEARRPDRRRSHRSPRRAHRQGRRQEAVQEGGGQEQSPSRPRKPQTRRQRRRAGRQEARREEEG